MTTKPSIRKSRRCGLWMVEGAPGTRSVLFYRSWGEALAQLDIPLPAGWSR